MAQSILVINGPNLNLLGQREPGIYGNATLASLEQELQILAARQNVAVRCFQSNHEGAMIDAIHSAPQAGHDFLIINAGGLTHTSVALRDAIAGVALPCVEVHISNVHRREAFRHHSLLSDVVIGSIVGLGTQGYEFALQFAARFGAGKAATAKD